jgi:hypothetical protein
MEIGDIFGEWKKKIMNIGFFRQIREINKRYAKPTIKITPMVSLALLVLRIYLIVLVVILAYKFFTLVR